MAGRGDRSLHLPLADFSVQLDLLEARCDVVPLGALLQSDVSAERPRVAITFDDAYRGAVTVGVAELARRGMPATIFVAPGLLGGRTLWWDQAAEAAGSCEVPPALRARALGPCKGNGDLVREDWARTGLTAGSVILPDAFQTATEDELVAAVARPGIGLGSHSWSHPNLPELDDDGLHSELTRPREWLAQWFPGVTIPCVAYPYGLRDSRVEQAAAAAGYAAGFRVEGGWLVRNEAPTFQTPRLNVPAGISPQRFRLHLSAVPWP
jgi:peptidoglycan/xylan/chitin deacetylase (PgdA/CDA1 family)